MGAIREGFLEEVAFKPHQAGCGASQVAVVVKNPLANTRDIRDAGSIPGSGRYSGGGHGNPLQYFYLENPMDCSPPGSSVHGILQAKILKWVAMPSSRGSS